MQNKKQKFRMMEKMNGAIGLTGVTAITIIMVIIIIMMIAFSGVAIASQPACSTPKPRTSGL